MPRKKKTAERGVGDNSGEVFGQAAQAQARSLADRIIRLMDDRDAVNEDIREVFNEAGESGLDKKILRKAVSERRKMERDAAAYNSEAEQIDLYLAAIWQAPEPFEPAMPRPDPEPDAEAEARMLEAGVEAD